MHAMSNEFRIRGHHVLIALLTFFAVIIAANTIFITYAIRSFPGEQEKKSYLQGLRYNETLAAREQQATLGWQASIENIVHLGDVMQIELRFVDRNNTPLTDLAISAILSRAVHKNEDRILTFEAQGAGRYRALVPLAGAGSWVLDSRANAPGGNEFHFVTRIDVPTGDAP